MLRDARARTTAPSHAARSRLASDPARADAIQRQIALKVEIAQDQAKLAYEEAVNGATREERGIAETNVLKAQARAARAADTTTTTRSNRATTWCTTSTAWVVTSR